MLQNIIIKILLYKQIIKYFIKTIYFMKAKIIYLKI